MLAVVAGNLETRLTVVDFADVAYVADVAEIMMQQLEVVDVTDVDKLMIAVVENMMINKLNKMAPVYNEDGGGMKITSSLSCFSGGDVRYAEYEQLSSGLRS